MIPNKAKKNKIINHNKTNNVGKLFLIATPIGNVHDWSSRAKQITAKLNFIFCEDTRTFRNLINQTSVECVAKLSSYQIYNEHRVTNKITELLLSGNDVGIVSDAGTPCISDPGFLAVREAHRNNIAVISVPGANSVITALSGSGFNCDKFVFLGFVPKTQKKCLELMQQFYNFAGSIIIFERPSRLEQLTNSIIIVFGENRKIHLSMELTKIFERRITLTTQQLKIKLTEQQSQQNKASEQFNFHKGECVVIIEGKQKQAAVHQDKYKNEK